MNLLWRRFEHENPIMGRVSRFLISVILTPCITPESSTLTVLKWFTQTRTLHRSQRRAIWYRGVFCMKSDLGTVRMPRHLSPWRSTRNRWSIVKASLKIPLLALRPIYGHVFLYRILILVQRPPIADNFLSPFLNNPTTAVRIVKLFGKPHTRLMLIYLGPLQVIQSIGTWKSKW